MNTSTGKTLIQPYLLFGGRCAEALEFYGKALGAQVDMMTLFNQNPAPVPPGSLPPGFEHKVVHASFRIAGNSLMASDGDKVGPQFSGFSLSLAVSKEEEAKRAFAALSDGGKVGMPQEKTFWSPCFGMVTDRFGLNWMISVLAT